jgi:hypothetical protein
VSATTTKWHCPPDESTRHKCGRELLWLVLLLLFVLHGPGQSCPSGHQCRSQQGAFVSAASQVP